MVDVDFGVVEQVRERDLNHRRRMRRELRRLSDEPVLLARLNGDELSGWALDRSDGGARVLLLSGGAVLERGEVVMLTVGDEAQMARIVWARHEHEIALFGLELVVVSGEVATVDVCALDLDLADVA